MTAVHRADDPQPSDAAPLSAQHIRSAISPSSIDTPERSRHFARRSGEDRALFARSQDGDARARAQLVERFLPLARSLALRYRRSGGESLDDLIQVASLGLVKAIDRYDPQSGNAFSSYAVPTIVGEIKRHFRDRTWSVRPPRGLQELTVRIERVVDELAEQLHRQPSVAEIATATGAADEDVLEALQVRGARRSLSLDMPRATANDPNDTTLGDSIGVNDGEFERAEDRATLARVLRMLTAREREILRMRFEQDMTQAQIGAAVGVSQMQISRIIRQTLARLHVDTHQQPPARSSAA